MFWIGLLLGSIITLTLVLVLSCLVASSRVNDVTRGQSIDSF